MFRDAGIAPGMRVLDIGCGAGDVSFLAAPLVGGPNARIYRQVAEVTRAVLPLMIRTGVATEESVDVDTLESTAARHIERPA